ncbi:MAG: ACT domain-containing protein [Candidatus Marinimicrobia bacterium CG_4_9_14_3_um_filter_48_9]|nr:MAG: ACT domain-containing protein [Candidatus Marinimicrobia bacterium CG_4_9_14_3_um_filter_48_9]
MPLSEEQIRNIVISIRQKLGPEASPDLIKSAANEAIREIEIQSTPTGESSTLADRVIVSIFGHNKMGIIAGVTAVLAQHHCNILDISQKIMGDLFTMILVVDIGHSSLNMDSLKDQLNNTANQLGVKIYVQNEAVFTAMDRL